MARPSTDLGAEAASVGAAVRERREALGMTRGDFARHAGVSYRMLQDLELGKRSRFADDVLRRIDDALGWAPGGTVGLAEGRTPVLADPRHSVETERARVVGEEIVQHIYRDLDADVADLPPERAEELTQRALEHARAQVALFMQAERERDQRRKGRDG